MTLAHGADATGKLIPLLLDASGRVLIQRSANSILRPSAVYTTTFNSGLIVNDSGLGLLVFLAVSAAPGVQTLVVSINTHNTIGNFGALLVGAAITAAGNYIYMIYPGIAAAGAGIAATAGFPLPRFYSVIVTHSGAGNWTYSLESNLIP